MLSRLRTFFTPPSFENDETSTNQARFINFLLWLITFSTLFFCLIWLLTAPHLAIRVLFAVPILPLMGLTHYFLSRKKLITAGLLIVLGLWLILIVSAWYSGGIHAPASSGFIVIVLLAALILGRKFALGLAGGSILVTLIFVLAENNSILSGDQYSTPFAIWASYTAYLLVAAFLLHEGTSNIREALTRAQQEIEERKRTELALREAELRYRTLVEHLPVVTYRDALDTVATPIYISPQIENLVGYAPHEWLDRPTLWLELLHPDDRVRVLETIENYIHTQTQATIEYRLRAKSGAWVWVRDEADVTIDANGEPLYVQGTLSDITARKEVEETLRTVNAELEERVQKRTAQLQDANRELESFSYSVSHDLRAPLRAINGFSRLFAEEYAPLLPPDAQRLQTLIQENALKMSHLIDNLLAFSRLGRAPLQKSPLQLEDLIREVWNDLALERENRQIAFTLHPLPPVQADPALLRQVFTNLLSNAIKFTRYCTNAGIEIGCLTGSGENIYYVRDNGAGFEMEYAHKLFGVFQRLHNETEFEGTGVGLAIVQRVIHRHGGKIWAEAKPEQGATFSFTLPKH